MTEEFLVPDGASGRRDGQGSQEPGYPQHMDVVKTLIAQTIANLSLALDPRDYAGNDSHAYRHEVTGKLLTLIPGMTDEDMGCALSILAISASTTLSPTRFRKVLRAILEREHKISSSIKSMLNDFAEYHISDGRMKGKIPLSGVSSMMPPAPFLHQCYYGGADRGGSNNFNMLAAVIEGLTHKCSIQMDLAGNAEKLSVISNVLFWAMMVTRGALVEQTEGFQKMQFSGPGARDDILHS